MIRFVTIVLSPHVRRWIYGVTIAALLLLTGYGILDAELVTLWAGLAAAVVGLAFINTPTGATPRQQPPDATAPRQ